MSTKKLTSIVAILGVMLLSSFAAADNFSFTGNFIHDNDVQAFGFNVGAASNVTLRAWSYAGGVNAAGQTIAEGGFDTILAVFDASGNLLAENDDGGCGLVAADSQTGQCWDTYLTVGLGAGHYTVTIMQYNNFSNGSNISTGFQQDGNTWFTDGFGPGGCANHFQDVSGTAGRCRNNDWAFDILNVNNAVETTTPEPGSLALLGSGLIGIGGVVRRKLAVR